MTLHTIDRARPALTLCGRRHGVPGGVIYPGVWAQWPQWFEDHPFPETLEGHTCAICDKKRG